MRLRPGVYPVDEREYEQVAEVWEAAVRATHDFVREEDILFFRPLVREGLGKIEHLAAVRDEAGQVAGFVGAEGDRIEMLFIHPDWRGMGAGRRLVAHAIQEWDARALDVNEQNGQALGFYLALGFRVVGRSELDGTGKPYPLLHMRLEGAGGAGGDG